MRVIWNILTFKRMVSPIIIQMLFWAGIGGSLYGAYVLYSMENWAWSFALIFGPLFVRLIFERAIIAFRSYDRLTEIAHGVATSNQQVTS